MASDLKGFVEDAKKLIGQEVDDVAPGTDLADWLTIRRFCAALGDPNLLYKDPSSGVATKYNSMIAPSHLCGGGEDSQLGWPVRQQAVRRFSISHPRLL